MSSLVMADFVRKKLQVFVSSTYSDLKVERQAAVSAILSAGHIPAGMELFTAGDKSQMEVIKQWIDESDVFMLILGGRYGSIEPISGKSYTHLEYDYAVSTNKPFFACVIQDDAIEKKVKAKGTAAVETAQGAKLAEFRAQVLGKLCKFWDDSKDIKIAVTETLSHLARRENLVGWVRATEETDLPALLNEITRLSQENAALRKEVGAGRNDLLINGLSFAQLKALLKKSGALEEMVKFRTQLVSRNGAHIQRSTHAAELLERGLIFRPSGSAFYKISPEGSLFFNRYDFEMMDEEGS